MSYLRVSAYAVAIAAVLSFSATADAGGSFGGSSGGMSNGSSGGGLFSGLRSRMGSRGCSGGSSGGFSGGRVSMAAAAEALVAESAPDRVAARPAAVSWLDWRPDVALAHAVVLARPAVALLSAQVHRGEALVQDLPVAGLDH